MALDFPTPTGTGQVFTAAGTSWTWDGVKWKGALSGSGGGGVVVGDTPPSSPTQGELWFDSVNPELYISYQDPNSQQWVLANSGGGAGAIAPGYPLMQGLQPTGGFTSSPFPFGTLNQATAFSCNIWPVDPNGRPTMPQVSGYHGPSDLATVPDRGYVTLYAGASSSGVTTVNVANANYTATTLVPTTPLTSAQVAFVQAAIDNNNQRASLWPAAYAAQNVGMQIDTLHTPQKYSAVITAVASDGSSVTVTGWFLVQDPSGTPPGNTSPGQVPPNGVGALINPCTHLWNMNGVSMLNAGDPCSSMTFLEADVYNYQTAFSGGSLIPTIGISCNSHANTNGYAYIALGNWYTGFLSRGNTAFGYLIQSAGTSSTNPAFGFVSQVPSNITGGHHPFGYWDSATAVPGYRYSVGSNGGVNCGNPSYDNGFAITVSPPGSPPVIQVVGPDTNIDLRLVTKGSGVVRTGGAPYQSNGNPAGIPGWGGWIPYLNVQGADGVIPALQMTSYGQRNMIMMRRADNTGAAPATLASGDLISYIAAAGYDGSAWSSGQASIGMSADGAWTTASHPTIIAFGVTSSTSTTLYERMRLFSSGNVGINPSNTAAALVDNGVNALQVVGSVAANANAAAIPAPVAITPYLDVQGVDNVISAVQITSYGQRCGLAMRRGNNVGTSPTALNANDPIVYFGASGHDGSAWSALQAAISMAAGAAWASGTHPTYISVSTTATGSTTMVERMRVHPSGNVMIQPAGGTFTDDGVNALQVTGSIRIGVSNGGPTWTSGAGVPSSTQPVGSIYSNTGGALGARLYVSAGGGTWNAVAGV